MRGDNGNSDSPTATIRLLGLSPEPVPSNDTSMKIGVDYAFLCKVTVTGELVDVEVRRDGQPLFHWAGATANIQGIPAIRSGTIGLQTAYYTQSRIRGLKLKLLSGDYQLIKTGFGEP